jgi:hypothetical protein
MEVNENLGAGSATRNETNRSPSTKMLMHDVKMFAPQRLPELQSSRRVGAQTPRPGNHFYSRSSNRELINNGTILAEYPNMHPESLSIKMTSGGFDDSLETRNLRSSRFEQMEDLDWAPESSHSRHLRMQNCVAV